MPKRDGMQEGRARWKMWLLVLVLLGGLGLRAAACRWNADVMHGDVGLFALAARELAENDSLDFPHRANFLGIVPYTALREPATLHNPLYATLAGTIVSWTQIHTYVVLRVLTWVSGAALLVLAICYAIRNSTSRGAMICALGIASSPLLVDFSGNGSPYILLALWLWGATAWLACHPPRRTVGLLLFGAMTGLATELHANQIVLPVLFLIVAFVGHPRIGLRGAIFFVSAYLLARAPAILWRWEHGVDAFSSGGGAAFLFRLGLLEASVSNEGQVQFLRHPLTEFPLLSHGKQVLAQIGWFLRDALREFGPFAIAIGLVGTRAALTQRKRWLGALPAIAYLLVLVLWARHDHRFLVPIVPLAWWLAGHGYDQLRASDNKLLRNVAMACAVGALAWPSVRLLRQPRAQYYGAREAQYQEEYSDLQSIAKQLVHEPPGLVLGWGRGEETVWTHRLPYISLIWASRPVFEAFVQDFQPRYVLTNTERIRAVQEFRPSARVLVQRRQFVLLSLQ